MEGSQPIYITGSFLGASGVELYRQSWTPAEPPRGRIIILHGYAEHSGRYAWTAKRMAEAGYSVFAYDQRGHGKSAGARVLVASYREHLDDLKAFIALIDSESSASPLFLFGHSMGGAIATLYISMRRHPFVGMILSGPAIRGPRALETGGAILELLGKVAPGLGLVRIGSKSVSRTGDVVAAYEADPLVFRGRIPAGTAAAYRRALLRIDREMDGISLPLLILHGGSDTLCPPEGSRQLHARVASEDKTLKLYDGLAHEILNEPEKESVLSDILNWLHARTLG